jgi:hypothetical protein
MNTNEKQEHIMGRVLLTAFRNGFVYDRTNAIHSGLKIHRQEYTSENRYTRFQQHGIDPGSIQCLQTWPSIRLREAAPGHIDTSESDEAVGEPLQTWHTSAGLYEEWIRRDKDERKKVSALALI